MVNLSGLILIGSMIYAAALALSVPKADDASESVRDALAKSGLPWYDTKTDTARNINLKTSEDNSSTSNSWSSSDSSRSTNDSKSSSAANSRLLGLFANTLSMVIFGVALAFLVGLLWWFWRLYEPTDEASPSKPQKVGNPSRVESLPEGMDQAYDSSDPWTEAIRRKERGDMSGAIICLFAHQLLTLSQLGLVRLAPGRTGRQLVRAVSDGDLRGLVQPTLRLFEVVYYGHRSPTEAEFTAVWMGAESFERRVAAGVIH